MDKMKEVIKWKKTKKGVRREEAEKTKELEKEKGKEKGMRKEIRRRDGGGRQREWQRHQERQTMEKQWKKRRREVLRRCVADDVHCPLP
jgi:hypothetical protein